MFYTSVPKLMITYYTVPDIWCMLDVIVFHLGYFLPFYPPNSPKNKNLKKHLEISSFYTSVPKIMIICYTILKIWCVKDVIVVFHSGHFFTLLPPPTAQKMEISKKWNNWLEISSFYTRVPKIMITCYTVLEIWHVADVIIFYFG